MKKLILAAIVVLGISAKAGAVQVTMATPGRMTEPVIAVIETSQSTTTVVGISISSQTPTSVVIAVGSTTAQYALTDANIRSVGVQNNDGASCNLFCGESVNVSSRTSNAHSGIKVGPGALVTFSIVPGTDFFCLNDTASRPCWASVYRQR